MDDDYTRFHGILKNIYENPGEQRKICNPTDFKCSICVATNICGPSRIPEYKET